MLHIRMVAKSDSVMVEWYLESTVRGYHLYKDVRDAMEGEVLQ